MFECSGYRWVSNASCAVKKFRRSFQNMPPVQRKGWGRNWWPKIFEENKFSFCSSIRHIISEPFTTCMITMFYVFQWMNTFIKFVLDSSIVSSSVVLKLYIGHCGINVSGIGQSRVLWSCSISRFLSLWWNSDRLLLYYNSIVVSQSQFL